MDETTREFIFRELRENQSPYFDEGDIEHYYIKNKSKVKPTIYEMLVIKSEDSTVSVSGLNTADTSNYFLRLASKYRPHSSRILGI